MEKEWLVRHCRRAGRCGYACRICQSHKLLFLSLRTYIVMPVCISSGQFWLATLTVFALLSNVDRITFVLKLSTKFQQLSDDKIIQVTIPQWNKQKGCPN